MMGDDNENALLVESGESFLKKILFKKKIPTMVLKPLANSDEFWFDIEKGFVQENTKVTNFIVQSKDSVLTEKQAGVFARVLAAQKELGSVALNFRK